MGGAFTEEGPSKEVSAQSSFTCTIFGHGENLERGEDVSVRASVSGMDPGYGGTAVMVVQSALTLMKDKSKIQAGNLSINAPKIEGGVFTPSVVFANTNLVQRLNAEGISFKIESEGFAKIETDGD